MRNIAQDNSFPAPRKPMNIISILLLITATKFSVVGLHINDKLVDGRGSEFAGVWALDVDAADKPSAEKAALKLCAARAPKGTRCQVAFAMPFDPAKPCHAIGIGLFSDTNGFRRDWEGSAAFETHQQAVDHATELLKENMFGIYERTLKMVGNCGGVS
jgi:hypothetical protein